MNYSDQLLTEDWSLIRMKVLERDGYCCQNCGNKKYLNDPELNSGLISKKGSIFSFVKELNIHVFGSESLRCKIRNELNQKLTEPSLLFFTINEEKWIEIIASRELSPQEILNYLDSTKTTVLDSLPESVDFNGDWTNFKWSFVIGLHIHHSYYQIGKLAWEYPVESLTTLCWKCHELLHKSSEIEVRDEEGSFLENRMACIRCHGAGWFPDYKHVEQGVCFRCRGSKFEEHKYT
jgi:hypothetical protein